MLYKSFVVFVFVFVVILTVVVMMFQLASTEMALEQHRIQLQKLVAEAEAKERCLREEMEEKVLFVVSFLYLGTLLF